MITFTITFIFLHCQGFSSINSHRQRSILGRQGTVTRTRFRPAVLQRLGKSGDDCSGTLASGSAHKSGEQEWLLTSGDSRAGAWRPPGCRHETARLPANFSAGRVGADSGRERPCSISMSVVPGLAWSFPGYVRMSPKHAEGGCVVRQAASGSADRGLG